MTYHNHYYNKSLKQKARELRTWSVSKAEKRIWKRLLSRKQVGVRFLRQRPIDEFIVDFFAPEIGLIIEVDGSSHQNKGFIDNVRQAKLEYLGYTVVRFSEREVLSDLDNVSEMISHAIFCLKEERS